MMISKDELDMLDEWQPVRRQPHLEGRLLLICYDNGEYDFAYYDKAIGYHNDSNEGGIDRTISYWRLAPAPPLKFLNIVE